MMPVKPVGFMMKPDGFFDRNPAMDLPPSPAKNRSHRSPAIDDQYLPRHQRLPQRQEHHGVRDVVGIGSTLQGRDIDVAVDHALAVCQPASRAVYRWVQDFPQQCLNFLPLPQEQGSFRPTRMAVPRGEGPVPAPNMRPSNEGRVLGSVPVR